jgi:hypothetical protein
VYAKLESTSLAPTIARALPHLSFFLNRHSLRTMCGSRTSEWSLPGVMSD